MTLAVVRQISDTVSVRVDGGLVETVFQHPESDRPRELIHAIPGGTTPVLDDAPT